MCLLVPTKCVYSFLLNVSTRKQTNILITQYKLLHNYIQTHLTNPLHSKNMLALVLTNGICFNTENANKRATPHLCDWERPSTSNMLNYYLGSSQEWIDKILLGTPMRACQEKILAGSYGIGSCPQR